MYIIPLQRPLRIPTKGNGQSALEVRYEVRALLALEKLIDANV